MDITELFDYILKEGCGTDLESYKDSQRFKELIKKHNTLFSRFKSDTDEGVMLRAGHFVGSTLLNCYSELEALSRAKIEESKFGHGLGDRALINFIGEEILRAAKDQLPIEAHYMAERWSTSTAHEQILITKELYHLFTHESQRDSKNLSMENLYADLVKERNNYEMFSGMKSCMPKAYGKWNREHHFANCQGKTQMIVAFANMVDARVVLMNPNTSARDILEDLRKTALEIVSEDIVTRKISFPDPEFMDSLSASRMKAEMKMKSDAFHLCPALQVSDGRWVIIDSNSLNWGVLGEEWGMDKIYPKLKKYSEVLPGMTLYASDNIQKEATITKIWEEFHEILSHSKKLEELLSPIDDLDELIEALAESSELDFLLSKTLDIQDAEKMDFEFRKFLATRMVIGDPSEMMFSYLDDIENFIQKKKDSLYTFYHCMASDLVDDRWNENGSLIHPEASFSYNVAYHIATSVINSVGIDLGVYGVSTYLAEYSCCQTTMHNAMISPHSTPELSKAAATKLSLMPFMHKLTKRSLTIKNYLDEQRIFIRRAGV